MVDKLFIPRTILKGIADSIRAKTGDTNSIKVKDMPSAIQNIPVGSTEFNTVLEDCILKSFIPETAQQKISGNLKAIIESDGVKVHDGSLDDITVSLYGISDNHAKWEYINDADVYMGKFEYDVEGYDMVKIACENKGIFKGTRMIVQDSILRAKLFFPETGQYTIQLTEQSDLETFIDGEPVDNNSGMITYDVDSSKVNKELELVYKGYITKIGVKNYNYYNMVTELDIPTTVKILANFFERASSLKRLIFRTPNPNLSEIPMYYFNRSSMTFIKLSDNITGVGNDCFTNIFTDYINIPAKMDVNSNIFSNFMSRCIEFESGRNSGFVDYRDMFSNADSRLDHLRLVGGTSAGVPSGLSYNTDWLKYITLYNPSYQLKYSFQPETTTILSNTDGSFLGKVRCIHIPVSCTKIEAGAFTHINQGYDDTITLIFDCPVPPVFTNKASDCFNKENSYKVIIPSNYKHEYREAFDDFDFASFDDEAEDEKGSFSFEYVGDKFVNNKDKGSVCNVYYAALTVDEQENQAISPYNGGSIEFPKNPMRNTDYNIHSVRCNKGTEMFDYDSFRNNKQLTMFKFPKALTNVLGGSFTNCRNLKTLIFTAGTVPEMDEGCFDGLHPLCKVFVPESMKNAFMQTELSQYEIIGYPIEYSQLKA